MKKVNFWLRFSAYAAVAGIAASYILEGGTQLPWVLPLIALFAVLLPVRPRSRELSEKVYLAVVLGQGGLVTLAIFLSNHPGTIMLLFFILLPICGRMMKPFSLIAYFGFPLLSCLPFFLRPSSADWSGLLSILPGFLAAIVFAEGYHKILMMVEEKQKLLDELVEAQKKLYPDALPVIETADFTRRDVEVLNLVAMGFSNKEIAARLFLAEGTVKNRVSALLEKIGARDRTQAALRARELGII